MSELSTRVEALINKAINEDKLILPTLPEIALKVRDIAENENATISQLGNVIQSDAALTTRIIKIANSPILRAPKEIENLNMALSRLGMKYTSNLAIGLAMEQMFQATSDFVDNRLRKTWAQSTEIAGMCNVLAKQFTNLQPDKATLAGLVHQIGVLPVLAFAEEHTALLRDSMTLETIIKEIHPSLGVRILTEWDFPTELRTIPLNYVDHTRIIDNADYADIVTVASIQSRGMKEETDYSHVTAFERLGLDSGVESTEAFDLSQEMENAGSLLQ